MSTPSASTSIDESPGGTTTNASSRTSSDALPVVTRIGALSEYCSTTYSSDWAVRAKTSPAFACVYDTTRVALRAFQVRLPSSVVALGGRVRNSIHCDGLIGVDGSTVTVGAAAASFERMSSAAYWVTTGSSPSKGVTKSRRRGP